MEGQVLAIPGVMPTATPSRAPHAARTSAWAAAIPRRVLRVAPTAARVGNVDSGHQGDTTGQQQ